MVSCWLDYLGGRYIYMQWRVEDDLIRKVVGSGEY